MTRGLVLVNISIAHTPLTYNAPTITVGRERSRLLVRRFIASHDCSMFMILTINIHDIMVVSAPVTVMQTLM